MVYQFVAAAVLLAFYGCYFCKMLLQRRKGIQTDQMGKGKTGRVLVIERTLKVATILVVIAEAAGVFLGASALPEWARTIGAVLAASGALVFTISVATMRDSWRAGVSEKEKTELVTGGIYAVSRNPAFLGFDLVYAGIALMFATWWLMAFSVFAMVMIHLQIVLVEEPFLRRTFGIEYADYEHRVCRYLGLKRRTA